MVYLELDMVDMHEIGHRIVDAYNMIEDQVKKIGQLYTAGSSMCCLMIFVSFYNTCSCIWKFNCILDFEYLTFSDLLMLYIILLQNRCLICTCY